MVLADDPAPTPVTGLYASIVTNSKVTLNWGYPATATDRDVTRIIVRGAPGSVPPATVHEGVDVALGRALQQYVTHANDLGVGDRYSYSVFTQDAAGNIGVPATITVPTSFPGPVTQALAVVDSPNSVTLTWTNPANDQLKKVIVRRAVGTTPPATPSSGSNVTLPAAVTQTVTDTGLSAGTTYSWSIFAQDRIGNISPLGSGSTAVANNGGIEPPPGGGDGPGPVTNLEAPIVTSAKVNLSWQYPSGTVRVIVRGMPGTTPPATVTEGAQVPTGRPVTTSATDVTGLEVGQRYSYSVFTQDASGRTSIPVSITVPVSMPAAVTQAAVAVDGPTSLTLTWTNPANDQLKTIIVRRAVGTTPPATTSSGTTVRLSSALTQGVTNTGLSAGTTYSYSVFAQDRVGNVSPLGTGSVVTATTG